MLSKGNSDIAVCVNNLLKTSRGEVPYERLKGVNFSLLDGPTTDAELIRDEIITELESSVGGPLYPGDERRMFAEALVAVFVSMYNSLNDAARQKMLRYARGSVLDALGERVGVARIAPTSATTTLRFSLSEPVGENVLIPQNQSHKRQHPLF